MKTKMQIKNMTGMKVPDGRFGKAILVRRHSVIRRRRVVVVKRG